MKDAGTSKSIQMALIKAGKKRADLYKQFPQSRPTIDGWINKGCTDITILREIAAFCGMSFKELMALGED